MNPKTAREKWVLTLLPAVFVVVIYVWTLARPTTLVASSLTAEVQKARDEGSIAGADDLLRKCQRISDEIEAEKNNAKSVENDPLPISRGIDRTQTLKTLTQLLEHNNLRLLSTTRLTETTRAGAGLEKLSKDLNSAAKLPAPQFWKFEFTGNYMSTVEALNAILTLRDFVVPTAIEMQPADTDAAERVWSLTVWM